MYELWVVDSACGPGGKGVKVGGEQNGFEIVPRFLCYVESNRDRQHSSRIPAALES